MLPKDFFEFKLPSGQKLIHPNIKFKLILDLNKSSALSYLTVKVTPNTQ